MIRPTPTSDAGRVLALLCDYPDELDTGAIGAHLWPAPKLGPMASPAAHRAAVAGRAQHLAVAAARASRALEGLRRLGLVEPAGAPRVASWFASRVAQRGARRALDLAALGDVGKVRPRHLSLLLRLSTANPPPLAALTATRAGQEAYRDLVRWGVVVPPSYRRASAEGVRWVTGWAAMAGAA